MNLSERVARLKELRDEIAAKKKKLTESKSCDNKADEAKSDEAKAKKVKESECEDDEEKEEVNESASDFARLMESDLEQAELILAAQDIMGGLQKMVEQIARMSASDVLPLADGIKSVFGGDVANAFEQSVNEKLESALHAMRDAKDAINTEIMKLEGKMDGSMPGNDMMGSEDDDASAPTSDDTLDSALGDDSGEGGEEASADGDEAGELDDLFGGDEAASGPADEPLGRAKKESAAPKGKMVAEAKKKKPDADGDGIPDWADKKDDRKSGKKDKKDDKKEGKKKSSKKVDEMWIVSGVMSESKKPFVKGFVTESARSSWLEKNVVIGAIGAFKLRNPIAEGTVKKK